MAIDDSDWKLDPDDQSERLYSLTLALLQTEVGLTKDEIFLAIRGYRMDVEKAGGLHGNLSSLNRKFDRDKDKLRDMGVSIEPAAGVNTGDSDYRYRISRDVFKWPTDTKLTAKQIQILELAGSVWSQAALSPEASNAVTRLRAIADLGDATIAIGISPRINTVEPSFATLRRAVGDHSVVSFRYRKPDGEESVRMVEPWQLVHTNGLWMLLAYDQNRQAPRNFLLKRIHSKVERHEESFDPPSYERVESAKNELAQLFAKNIATIRVKPGTTAAMHFEVLNSENSLVTLNYYDIQLLAEELMEFGRGVSVVSPPELIAQITQNLQQVIRNHA